VPRHWELLRGQVKLSRSKSPDLFADFGKGEQFSKDRLKLLKLIDDFIPLLNIHVPFVDPRAMARGYVLRLSEEQVEKFISVAREDLK